MSSTLVANNLPNYPKGQINSQFQIIPESFNDESFRGEYDADSNMIYKGYTRPGGDESALIWQIAFLTYDGNGNVLSIKWPMAANGIVSTDYSFSWSLRATYIYS